MATLQISNTLKTEKSAFDLCEVRNRFTYPNPRFFENQRLGLSTFSIPQSVSLFKENGRGIEFPRGLISELFEFNSFEVQDLTATNPVQFKDSKIILKDYQAPAVEAFLQRNQGILVAPPGSGKTVVGIELIIERGQKSLVLVHTKDLLTQWTERFRQFTDIEPGRIDADGQDIRDVTIGMVQSLRGHLSESFLNQLGLVLLDECHHCPAYTFQELINQFPARFRYGLTATPERRDGLSFVLQAVLGNIVYEIKREGLFEQDQILKPRITVLHTNFYQPDIGDYASLIERIILDPQRNAIILKKVIREAEEGHFCLVLSNRIDHAEWLYTAFSMVEPDIRSACLTSKSAKGERDLILQQMNEGDIRVLFATQLADEGLDIRRLDRLFLTCPIRSVNRVNQQVGRILRTFPGKQDAVVFDFRDSLCSLAESQFHTRLKQVYADFVVEEVPYSAE